MGCRGCGYKKERDGGTGARLREKRWDTRAEDGKREERLG